MTSFQRKPAQHELLSPGTSYSSNMRRIVRIVWGQSNSKRILCVPLSRHATPVLDQEAVLPQAGTPSASEVTSTRTACPSSSQTWAWRGFDRAGVEISL